MNINLNRIFCRATMIIASIGPFLAYPTEVTAQRVDPMAEVSDRAGLERSFDRERFTIDPKLTQSYSADGLYCPATTPSFDQITSPAVIRNLNLKENVSAELARRADKIRKEWYGVDGAWSQFVKSKNPDMLRNFNGRANDFVSFLKFLDDNLSQEQFDYLAWLERRRLVLQIGVLNYVSDPNLFAPDLENERRTELVESIREIFETKAREGNALYFEFLHEHAPGYTYAPELAEGLKLPDIPLKIILRFLEYREEVVPICDKALESSSVEIAGGQWSFWLWDFGIDQTCELVGYARNNAEATSMARFVYAAPIIQFERTMEQAQKHYGMIFSDEPLVSRDEKLSPDQYWARRIEREKALNEGINDSLIPQQIAELAYYVRFHSSVVFGVHYVVKRWHDQQGLAVDEAQFEAACQEFHDRLYKHCLDTELEIEKLINDCLESNKTDSQPAEFPFRNRKWKFNPPDLPVHFELYMHGINRNR